MPPAYSPIAPAFPPEDPELADTVNCPAAFPTVRLLEAPLAISAVVPPLPEPAPFASASAEKEVAKFKLLPRTVTLPPLPLVPALVLNVKLVAPFNDIVTAPLA